MATKHTVKPSEIVTGDEVIGFGEKVASVTERRTGFGYAEVAVRFESGRVWRTSDHFETSVIRA